jgi:hypothetical protein
VPGEEALADYATLFSKRGSSPGTDGAVPSKALVLPYFLKMAP